MPDMPLPPPDRLVRSLLRRARRGSKSDLGRLLEGYRALLMALAEARVDAALRRKLGPSDVVQKTMLEAQRDLPGAPVDTPQELLRWLTQALYNNLKDELKKHAPPHDRRLAPRAARRALREPPLDAEARAHLRRRALEQQGPRTLAELREKQALLEAALGRLPPRQRQVIELRRQRRMSFAKIAAQMESSEDAVRKPFERAVKALSRQLREPDDEA